MSLLTYLLNQDVPGGRKNGLKAPLESRSLMPSFGQWWAVWPSRTIHKGLSDEVCLFSSSSFKNLRKSKELVPGQRDKVVNQSGDHRSRTYSDLA